MSDKKQMVGQGGGVYFHSGRNRYYHRPMINGKPTWRVLGAVRKLGDARQLKAQLDSDQSKAQYNMPGAKDPYAKPPPVVMELIEEYIAAGCPKRKNQNTRTGDSLELQLRRLRCLTPFWANRVAESVTNTDCMAYKEERRKSIRNGFGGECAIDVELGIVYQVLHYARLRGRIQVNGLADRQIFTDPKARKRCRLFRPENIDEVHLLARTFFSDRRSEGLGWYVLLLALTGCRSNEIRMCRWDARNKEEPGFIQGNYLYIKRQKGGINPMVKITPALAEVLEAMKRWRVWRGLTDSEWFITSYIGRGNVIGKAALTLGLGRIAKRLGLKHRTAHGLRSFYVTVRRSMRIEDLPISVEIGDRTGAAIIVDTYGDIPPDFFDGEPLTFIPKGDARAWDVLDMPQNVVSLKEAVA